MEDEEASVIACRELGETALEMINVRNYNGFTPLMRAVRAQYRRTALTLIALGADCEAETPKFWHNECCRGPGSWLRSCCKPRDYKPPIFLCLVRRDFALARALMQSSPLVMEHRWLGRDAEGSEWQREVLEYAKETAKCFEEFVGAVADLMTGDQLLRAINILKLGITLEEDPEPLLEVLLERVPHNYLITRKELQTLCLDAESFCAIRRSRKLLQRWKDLRQSVTEQTKLYQVPKRFVLLHCVLLQRNHDVTLIPWNMVTEPRNCPT
ncbi:hypothetical protein GNI_019990 [Gregarina niphandrodes]|uniref:Ankyrin repeat protein n=1 Tax=Gregarina niphandrodes TaxID=110365 RepID=A0A023BC08_GRENI|nr:hypothetical protein GNI_019990 [Gregarina niphandrodes]EZG81148.1 hypothetical protein GNI_019990 [Gregarina niphandrodes]|eukprot:XP_011134263.1 hypothetical protein GNI_019990 [Gregarina niphandrodes]